MTDVTCMDVNVERKHSSAVNRWMMKRGTECIETLECSTIDRAYRSIDIMLVIQASHHSRPQELARDQMEQSTHE